jgi:anti-repressor protein
MNALIPFAFDTATIRVVQDGGEVWFVGRDVALTLGYANLSDAMEKHCRGVVKRYPLQTAGGVQELRVLSQADVLRLVVRSRLPSAERFERWVFEEVLPSIARTGGYGKPDALAVLSDPAALRALLLDYSERAISLERQVNEQAPKVAALETIAGARGALCLTDTAKALKVRRSDLLQWMQEHSWIYKREGSNWKAYQPRITAGMLAYRVVARGPVGDERLFDQVLVTPRGLARLAELMARQGEPA